MSYTNGSNLLLSVGGKAIGHCTTHTVTYNSETKDRAVKPAASEPKSSGFWKEKGITGLSISISAEGLVYTGEKENGFAELSALWGAGASVEVKAFEREDDTNPSIVGKFVIASLEQVAAAQDDTTYSISLENDGAPSVYPGLSAAVGTADTASTKTVKG